MTELKCPKCKETEEIYYVFDSVEKGHGIKCYKCGYEIVGCKSIEEAEFKWRSKNDPKALKPCPFCGSPGYIYAKRGKSKGWYDVGCSKFGCIKMTQSFKSAEEGAKAWNRRVGE